MTYSDFTLERIVSTFPITLRREPLFAQVPSLAVPALLRAVLDEGMALALISEKARSELIVMPVLLGVRILLHRAIAIYSGQRLDSDPAHGLVGECDFLLTPGPPLPILQLPLVTVVEAKKNDIDAGIGQCAAQMIGARLVNERDGRVSPSIFGCVTTGEDWQFLQLAQQIITIDSQRYYINDVGSILGVFHTILAPHVDAAAREVAPS